MKKIHLLLILMAFVNHAVSQTISHQTNENFKKLSWLAGTWDRTNAKPGHSGHERWELTSANELRGFGINLQGKDTAFIEKLGSSLKMTTSTMLSMHRKMKNQFTSS